MNPFLIATFSTILYIFALLSAGISGYIFFSFNTTLGRQLGVAFFAASVGSFAYGLEIASPSLQVKLAMIAARYFVLAFFNLAITLYVFNFTRISVTFRSKRFLALSLGMLVPVFFLAAYPTSRLVYENAWLDTSVAIPMVQKTVGPLYYFIQAYFLGLTLYLTYLVGKQIPTLPSFTRRQSLIIFAGLGLVVGTQIAYLAGARVAGNLSPNPFSMLPAAGFILWGAKYYRLADIRPIARHLLFTQMQDGILVVDPSGSLIDINPAAEKLLGFCGNGIVGGRLINASPQLSALLTRQDEPGNRMFEMTLCGVPVQVTVNPITAGRGEAAGRLVILRDISDRREAEALKEAEAVGMSAWAERQKVARALHDSVIQYLNSMVLLSGSARQRLEQARYDQLAPLIEHIETSARQSLREMRQMIHELQLESPAAFDFNLISACNECVWMIRGSYPGLDIDWQFPEKISLNNHQQREVFYILIEALNNCLEHAGADSARVSLAEEDGKFRATFSDNGVGFDTGRLQPGGIGLGSMRQRAADLSGELLIESAPGSGTRLSLIFPLAEQKGFKGEPC